MFASPEVIARNRQQDEMRSQQNAMNSPRGGMMGGQRYSQAAAQQRGGMMGGGIGPSGRGGGGMFGGLGGAIGGMFGGGGRGRFGQGGMGGRFGGMMGGGNQQGPMMDLMRQKMLAQGGGNMMYKGGSQGFDEGALAGQGQQIAQQMGMQPQQAPEAQAQPIGPSPVAAGRLHGQAGKEARYQAILQARREGRDPYA